QRAAKREVRLRRLLWRPLLQRDDVFFRRAIFTRRFRHAMGFAVDCLEMGHGQHYSLSRGAPPPLVNASRALRASRLRPLAWPQALSDGGFSPCFVTVESLQEPGSAFGQLTVNPETRVGPSSNPFAVVQVRAPRCAVPHVRFVVAAARTERPRPAAAAVGLVGNVMLLEERRLRAAIDPVA